MAARSGNRGIYGPGVVILLSLVLVSPALQAAPLDSEIRLNPLPQGASSAGPQPGSSPSLEPDPRLVGVGELLRSRRQRTLAARRSATTAAQLGEGQREALRGLRTRVGDSLRVQLRPGSLTPRQLKGGVLHSASPRGRGRARDMRTVRGFLRAHRDVLRLDDPDRELTLERRDHDQLGRRHLRFSQRYRGLRVWPAELIVHLDPDGNVDLLDGAFVPSPRAVAPEPAIDAAQAVQRAREEMPGAAAGSSGTSELLIYAPGDRPPRLAWRIDLPVDLTSHWLVIIDAQNGEKLLSYNRVQHADVEGEGADLFGVVRTLHVWEEAGEYSMVDASKPMFDPNSDPPDPATTVGGIVVMDAQNEPPTSAPSSLPPLAQVTSVDPLLWNPADAVSASFSLSETYDYYLERHGRDSLDGEGGTILGVVRLGLGYGNAFWSSALGLMAFGDAEPFAGALDVVGHEATHAVIDSTASLIYENQPGAANEAFADIFGEMVEARSEGGPDWQVGSNLSLPFRSLSDPSSLEICCGRGYPEKMSEFIGPYDPLLDLFIDRDYGGVHLNATIPGHAFYLLAAGLDGAIGNADAEAIFYRALAFHLVANSQFVDVRLACIQAAEELFGVESIQAQKTIEAFDAVEIFDGGGTPDPPDFPGIDGDDALLYVRMDPSFPGSVEFLERRETALGDPSFGAYLSSGDVASKRSSVTGDGSEVWFINGVDDLCVMETAADILDPNDHEVCIQDPELYFNSVAVSRDGNLVSVVLLDMDNPPHYPPESSVTVIDLRPGGEDRTYDLATLTHDGPVLANVLYADAMTFRAAGDYLLFDALNEIPLVGFGSIELWSLYSLDLDRGELRTLVEPSADFDFGFPSLSHTSDNFIVFDAIDWLFGVTYVLTGDLNTGQVEVADTVFGSGTAPVYTGDDGALVYSFSSLTSTGFSLWHQPLASDRMTPVPGGQVWMSDAKFGVVYRRGDYQGPEPDRDLDGITDEVDNCPEEPNSDQSDVGGIGAASEPDGIGDACQCGDVHPDGRVTSTDVTELRLTLAGFNLADFAQQNCSTIGGIECDVTDLVVLQRELAGYGPSIAQVCASSVP